MLIGMQVQDNQQQQQFGYEDAHDIEGCLPISRENHKLLGVCNKKSSTFKPSTFKKNNVITPCKEK
jgi:hypothetical protein